MDIRQELDEYLKREAVMTLATSNGADPWICTVYYGYSEGKFYFTSKQKTRHAQDIGDGGTIAFAIADSSQTPAVKTVGVQGVGFCRPAKVVDAPAMVLHYGKRFTEFMRDFGNLAQLREMITGGANQAYVLEIETIKYTNKNLFKDAQIIKFKGS